jgi:hypothetical protein
MRAKEPSEDGTAQALRRPKADQRATLIDATRRERSARSRHFGRNLPGPDDPQGPLFLSGVVGALAAQITAAGIATQADNGMDTLQERVAREPPKPHGSRCPLNQWRGGWAAEQTRVRRLNSDPAGVGHGFVRPGPEYQVAPDDECDAAARGTLQRA